MGYRGEVKVRFKHIPDTSHYRPGDRVCQLMIVPYPQIELQESEELSDSDRSDGGFGSTGN